MVCIEIKWSCIKRAISEICFVGRAYNINAMVVLPCKQITKTSFPGER